MDGVDDGDWLGRLAADLARPALALAPAEALALWMGAAVLFECERPALLVDYPELPLRIRGAWGRRLLAQSPPRRRGFALPPPAQALFSPLGRWASGLEIPKPVVIRAWLEGERLFAEVRVFGWAEAFLDAAADALAEALEGGVAPAPGSRLRVPARILSAGQRAVLPAALPRRAGAATLTFRTPAAARERGRLKAHPATLAKGMVRRVSGMARWMGVGLDFDAAALGGLIDSLDYDERDLLPVRWTRHSIRQPGYGIPAGGVIGRLGVIGPLAPLVPFLLMAETCNTGSHAALGLGWFEAAIYP